MPRCRRTASGVQAKEIIMIKTHDRFTVIDGVTATDTAAQQREDRATARFTAWLAMAVAIALGMSAWLFVSTGVPDVSAAAADARSTPQVPYFPSLYVNQATENEPPPATF
jgi:hypothetical protein